MNPRLLSITALLALALLAGCLSAPLPAPPYFGLPSPKPPSGVDALLTPTAGDYATLVTRLQNAGAQVEEIGATSRSIFSGDGRIVRVNGGEVQVFEYPDEGAAQTEAGRLSPDGSTFNEAKVDWAGPLHVYQRGRILVTYVGNDTRVINPLEFVLGRQIAGITVSGTAVALNPLRTPTATRTVPATIRAVATARPPGNCRNGAAFVADVTIPDDTVMPPSQGFVKTWRLKNTGTCPWTTDYAMVYSGGTGMGAPAAVPFSSEVAPGSTMDISVTLTAPATPGSYRGNYRLRDANNQPFGIGTNRNSPFWVQLVVNRGSPPLPSGSAASRTATPQPTPQPSAQPSPGPTSTGTPGPAPTAAVIRQRINIPAGVTAVSVSFRLAPNRAQEYVLRMAADQHLRIWLDAPGTTLSLSGADGVVEPIRTSTDKLFFEYALPATGDYVISLQGASNTIILEIPPT